MKSKDEIILGKDLASTYVCCVKELIEKDVNIVIIMANLEMVNLGFKNIYLYLGRDSESNVTVVARYVM